ncbi:MAG: hypothetical protein R2827_02710 [Bdellovibrionales bacterium]
MKYFILVSVLVVSSTAVFADDSALNQRSDEFYSQWVQDQDEASVIRDEIRMIKKRKNGNSAERFRIDYKNLSEDQKSSFDKAIAKYDEVLATEVEPKYGSMREVVDYYLFNGRDEARLRAFLINQDTICDLVVSGRKILWSTSQLTCYDR